MASDMPCEDCEQGLSNCCRIVKAQDIWDALPKECWISRDEHVICTRFIGGTFDNGAEWTAELCCLPCRIRLVIETTAVIP